MPAFTVGAISNSAVRYSEPWNESGCTYVMQSNMLNIFYFILFFLWILDGSRISVFSDVLNSDSWNDNGDLQDIVPPSEGRPCLFGTGASGPTSVVVLLVPALVALSCQIMGIFDISRPIPFIFSIYYYIGEVLIN